MATDDKEPIPEVTKLPRKVWVSILAGGAVLIVLPFCFIYLTSLIRSDETARTDAQDLGSAPSPIDAAPHAEISTNTPHTDPQPQVVASQAVDSIALQKNALQQAKLLRLRSQGDRIKKQWDDLATARDRLRISLDSLLGDGTGRKIASNPGLVAQYEALRESSHPSPDDAQQNGATLVVGISHVTKRSRAASRIRP